MNIEIRNKALTFMELAVGEGFVFNNSVFIKTTPFNDYYENDLFNAISLINGGFAYFDNEENVIRVNKMILE